MRRTANRCMQLRCSWRSGTLRPTIFVGIGGFGLQALKELRRRLLDRVGDLTQTPSFRFIYMDPDPDAVTEATNGPTDKVLRDEQVFPIRLQPITNYRRRILDHLNEWLPREKLYSLPRSLQTMGSRALGRLAFCDNYLRFETRFSREVQVATHPESLAQTMTQSGMTLRDNCPRVYILAAATGGSFGHAGGRRLYSAPSARQDAFPQSPGQCVSLLRRTSRPRVAEVGARQPGCDIDGVQPLPRPGDHLQRPIRRSGWTENRRPGASLHQHLFDGARESRAGRSGTVRGPSRQLSRARPDHVTGQRTRYCPRRPDSPGALAVPQFRRGRHLVPARPDDARRRPPDVPTAAARLAGNRAASFVQAGRRSLHENASDPALCSRMR